MVDAYVSVSFLMSGQRKRKEKLVQCTAAMKILQIALESHILLRLGWNLGRSHANVVLEVRVFADKGNLCLLDSVGLFNDDDAVEGK